MYIHIVYIYVYVYIYLHIFTHIYVYIYIYIVSIIQRLCIKQKTPARRVHTLKPSLLMRRTMINLSGSCRDFAADHGARCPVNVC